MGESWLFDYYRFAFRALAAFCELMVKSLTLNPYKVTWAYLIWNFAPVFGQQISILELDPLTLDFLVCLGLNFHPMDELQGEGVSWASDIFFVTDINVTTWVTPHSGNRRD